MAKNNSKPYNDKKNTKNSKNSSKKKNIENTTKIRIDRERLNDSESLDTSFLEGRFSKKVPSSKEKRDLLISEKSKKIQKVELLKKLFYSLSIFCILVLGIMAFFANNPITLFHKKERLEEPIAIQKADDTLDRNYLFVGDYHTDEFDFSLYHKIILTLGNKSTVCDGLLLYNPIRITLPFWVRSIFQRRSWLHHSPDMPVCS